MFDNELIKQKAHEYARDRGESAEVVSDFTTEELLFNLLVDVARAYAAEIEVNAGCSHEEAESAMFVGLKENLAEIARGN